MRTKLIRIASLICSVIILAVPARAFQQDSAPAEGQVLHILVNKSVVINNQAPVVRVLTSNPAAIEKVATSPTQIVVSGKGPGNSSLIIWDSHEHSQLLDVVVEPDISVLRAAIERSYPSQHITVETDGLRLILSGSVSSTRIVEDVVLRRPVGARQHDA